MDGLRNLNWIVGGCPCCNCPSIWFNPFYRIPIIHFSKAWFHQFNGFLYSLFFLNIPSFLNEEFKRFALQEPCNSLVKDNSADFLVLNVHSPSWKCMPELAFPHLGLVLPQEEIDHFVFLCLLVSCGTLTLINSKRSILNILPDIRRILNWDWFFFCYNLLLELYSWNCLLLHLFWPTLAPLVPCKQKM